jgi:glycerate 2-kinase
MTQLADDARRIWQAGVESVRPEQLIPREVEVAAHDLRIGDLLFDLRTIDRLVVVGGGKAGGAMARGLEQALGPEILAKKHVTGWMNVPEGCVLPTERVHLHPSRPAGVNEPRPAGVDGARQILNIVRDLSPRDMCLCLLSGGASALLPAPAAGVSLADKVSLARVLSSAGANIEQLNLVRRQLSDIKGGGLARACRSGTLITLVLSDVLGDPLHLIGSGPTVPNESGPAEALAVLEELAVRHQPELAKTVAFLERRLSRHEPVPAPVSELHSVVLANNATAVDAAGCEAERLGYQHAMISATASEGPAEDVGRHLARMALDMRDRPGPNCLISGGEPTVTLAPAERRGLGGRNQQLTLAALEVLGDCRDVALLSGGTDGEDGPTDAAGAWIDSEVAQRAANAGLAAGEYLARNDAYHFFESAGGLLKTGPTNTNVCDLRVTVVRRGE